MCCRSHGDARRTAPRDRRAAPVSAGQNSLESLCDGLAGYGKYFWACDSVRYNEFHLTTDRQCHRPEKQTLRNCRGVEIQGRQSAKVTASTCTARSTPSPPAPSRTSLHVAPMPRSLKLPDGCAHSILSRTSRPSAALSASERSSSVATCSEESLAPAWTPWDAIAGALRTLAALEGGTQGLAWG